MADSRQIFIVEDDEDTQFVLSDTLRQMGYPTASAATAEEALSDPKLERAGVFLLDRVLPDSTAEQLLPDLRRRSPDSFVVVMTGHGNLNSAITCMRLGASDYLLKPVDGDALVESLERIRNAQHAAQQKLQTTRLARQLPMP